MKNPTLRSLVLFAALLPPVAAPVTAQEAVTPPRAATPRGPVTVSLAFPGGSLAEFVAAVRRGEPRANIIVAAPAGEAVLPQMDLVEAGIEQALDAACSVATGPHEVRSTTFRGDGEPVHTLRVVAAKSRSPQILTEVHGLASLRTPADTLPPETVLSAIELAVGEPRLETLAFHRESRLVIVRGTGAQLQVVHAVLQALDRDRSARQVPVEPDGARPADAVKQAK